MRLFAMFGGQTPRTILKKVTLKDIASRLGISISAVSKALKNHPDIGPVISAEVRRLAAELHYKPSQMALQLRGKSSKTIGLIVPRLLMFFYPQVIQGVEEVLKHQGFSLMVLQSNDRLQQELENVQICYENEVAGLLIALSAETKNLDHLLIFQEIDVPVVLFDKTIDHEIFTRVVINDYEIGQKAARLLLESGATRILGIFGPLGLEITKHRQQGFLQTIEKEAPNTVVECHHVPNSAEALGVVEQEGQRFEPNGLFAMSDETLLGALTGLKNLQIPIPEKCRVLAVSDGSLPEFLYPGITHIRHDGFALGQRAARELLARIKSELPENAPFPTCYIETDLVSLGSL